MSLLDWTSDLARWLHKRQDTNFDHRWGFQTCEVDWNPDASDLPENLRPDARHYAPTPIALFGRFVRRSRVNPRDFGFVDLGAGKGRTLLLAARAGFDPIVGVEIAPGLCQTAETNLRRRSGGIGASPKMINGDARTAELPAGNLFVFMFNPFTGSLFEEVANRLADISREEERAVVIAYHNDVCSDALERTGAFKRVRMRRIHFWRPPTASFFYNEAAWRMRRGF